MRQRNLRLGSTLCSATAKVLPAVALAASLGTASSAQIVSYDPALGTLPQAQGFTYVQAFTAAPQPVVAGGTLHQGPTAYDGLQYWPKSDVPINYGNGFFVEATLKVTYSTYFPDPPNAQGQRFGWYLDVTDASGHEFTLGVASGGIAVNTDLFGSPTNGVPFTAFDTTDAFHTYRVVVAQGVGSVYIDNTLYGTTPIGAAIGTSFANRVFFGDGTREGDSQTELSGLRYGPVPEPSTFLVLAIGAGLCRRLRSRR